MVWLIKQRGYKRKRGWTVDWDMIYTKNWFIQHSYFLWQRQDDRLPRSVVSVSAGKHAVIRRVMPGQRCTLHCYTAHPRRLAGKVTSLRLAHSSPAGADASACLQKKRACVSHRMILLLKSGTWQRRHAHLSADPGLKLSEGVWDKLSQSENRLRGALHLLRVKSLLQMLAKLLCGVSFK